MDTAGQGTVTESTRTKNGKAEAKKEGSEVPEEIGDDLSAGLAGWTFSGGVYRTFDEHIARSVPMYAECHDLILELSDFFVRKDSLIYELGTATGTLAGRIAQRHAKKIRRVIGIDIEQAMVAEAARKCGMIPGVEFVEADLMAYRFEPCDLVISYYTLQFLRLEERHDVIRSIYDRLARGGAFVLFEKVREPDGQLQDLIGQLYLDYKLQHGFTPGEVMAKSRSIRSVLEPSTSEENQDALRAAGFRSVGIVHKSLCFEGYLAVK